MSKKTEHKRGKRCAGVEKGDEAGAGGTEVQASRERLKLGRCTRSRVHGE